MISEKNKEDTMKNISKNTTKKTSKSKKIEITKFEDLEGKFLHITVGTKSEPANDDQLSAIKDQIISLFEENNINCLTFVTHHAVSMSIVEKDNKN